MGAQSSNAGIVEGIVVDASEAIVVGARVTLISGSQARVNSIDTDAQGRFRFHDVPAGTYELIIAKEGFDDVRAAARVGDAEASGEVRVTLGVRNLNEQITVSAETGAAENKEKIPQAINVISEESLRQRTTAVLAQVADEETGVSMQRTSPTIGAVVVRGLSEVGVYVDGVRYTNATQRGGINTFFNLVEPTSLRAVEVLRGTNTAQYGSDSLGGTVQVLSRLPEFGTKEPQTHGEVNTFFKDDRSL